MVEFADGYLLTAGTMAWFTAHYMGDQDLRHPRASPIFAASLAGQPPALVFTCGLDPLRDQGRAYAGKLIAAGVRTIYREAAGQIHGSVTLRGAIPSAQDDLHANLRDLRTLIDEASAAG
jgi:acetyl esterase